MSDNNKGLPRGIWYEEAKKRYRVRLYRNNISYLGGYFAKLPEAEKALVELKDKLSKIPKRRRVIVEEPYQPSAGGHLTALSQASELDPRTKRLKAR